MKDVFISFSSKETAEAIQVCELLEKNHISCFISTRDLVPGREYAEQLVQNIDEVKAVVLLLSNNSNNSPHVLREIEYAVSHKVPILVHALEEVSLSKSMEYYLMTHQWITNTADRDQKLVEGIRQIISKNDTLSAQGEAAPAEKADSAPHAPSRDRTSWKKRVLYLLLMLCAIALCGGIVYIRTRPRVTYQAGDTVEFGTYYDEPIQWRVLKINEDNTMVLISKDILTIKSFDAPEGGTYNEYDGVDYWSYENHNVEDEDLIIKIRGNNDWSKSNLRTWLNSDTEMVNYPDQAPTYSAVGENFYSSEPGFLYAFTQEEKDALVTVENRSTANSFSEGAVDGYVTSQEKVYLLSSEELDWFSEAGMLPYASPTESCKEHDGYLDSFEVFAEAFHTDTYYWWLRDNGGEEINKVYVAVTENETDAPVASVNCGASDYGVRPAVTVDMKSSSIRKLQ